MHIENGYFCVHLYLVLIMIGVAAVAHVILSMTVFDKRREQRVLRLFRVSTDHLHARDIGRICGLSAPYVVLGNLEERGYIKHVDIQEATAGLPARFYSLTAAGRNYLASSR